VRWSGVISDRDVIGPGGRRSRKRSPAGSIPPGEGQIEMGRAVALALEREDHLNRRAGTGTGKKDSDT